MEILLKLNDNQQDVYQKSMRTSPAENRERFAKEYPKLTVKRTVVHLSNIPIATGSGYTNSRASKLRFRFFLHF